MVKGVKQYTLKEVSKPFIKQDLFTSYNKAEIVSSCCFFYIMFIANFINSHFILIFSICTVCGHYVNMNVHIVMLL